MAALTSITPASRPAWWIWPVLTAATLLAQGGIAAGNFYLDDYFYLHLARAGAHPFAFFFQDLWFGVYFRPGFYPLFWSIFQVFGAKAAPFLAVNLLLVVGTVWLLFATLRRWLGGDRPAFSAALLFAVLPTTAIGAHFVWNMTEVLGVFLGLLSLHLLQGSLETGGRKRWIAAAAVAFYAMLCKENLAVLALFAPAVAWRHYRSVRPTLRAAWPFWAALAVYLAWRTAMLHSPGGYRSLSPHLIDPLVMAALPRMLAEYFSLAWIALAVGLAAWLTMLVIGRRTAVRPALLGLLAMVLLTLPMLPNLNNKVMALWLPLRFFYLTGLGVAVLLAAIAGIPGKKGRAANLTLMLLAVVLAVNSVSLAWSFSRWQDRLTARLLDIGRQVTASHPDAPTGSVFYVCTRPHDHALDAGLKFHVPALLDRYVFLYCADRTEVIVPDGLADAVPVSIYYDKMLRRNPSHYRGRSYGVAGANPKKVAIDAQTSANVFRIDWPDTPDPITDRFMPLGRAVHQGR